MEEDDSDPDQDAPAGYDDEILDANWLPRPEGELRVVRSAARDETHPPAGADDAEAFLRAIYRNQE